MRHTQEVIHSYEFSSNVGEIEKITQITDASSLDEESYHTDNVCTDVSAGFRLILGAALDDLTTGVRTQEERNIIPTITS